MPESRTVLVCDDEPLLRWSVVQHLRESGYEAHEAEDGAAAVRLVGELSPDAVVLDLKLPKIDGLTALKQIRDGGSEVPVVVMTAHGGVDSAITATRLGAGAYLEKPFDLREISLALDRVWREDRLRQEVHLLRDRQRSGYGEFIGNSEALRPLFTDLSRLEAVVAPTVLILGESGSGKDVVARMIHARGPRKDGIYVEVDCASLTESLIESELFGYERGAFTDAKAQKRGLFEAAGSGVVFLDEIGEISLATQAKLLRALENRTFKRVGGLATLKLDAQVVAATNRDLKKEVEKGRFREDLYYRLHVVTLRIPSLKERRDDVPLLASHFLERFNKTFGRSIEGISGDAMAMLKAYDWPGNVRELKNLLERIVILGVSGRISADELPPEVRFARVGAPPPPSGEYPFVLPDTGVDLDAVEKQFVEQAIARTRGNQSAAAKLLGMSRYQLRYRLEKLGLEKFSAERG
jgi:two-component system response regulator AtoC